MTITTNQPQTTAPNLADALGDEETCIAKLRQMLRTSDILPAFPLTTAAVSELLRENGYAVAESVLEDWARRSMIPDCVVRQGRFCWSARNTLTAAIHVDTWRMFVPLHPRHLHRLSALELAEQQAAAAGGSVFTDADVFSTRAFLQMIDGAVDAGLRHTLVVALRTRLDRLGVLDS